MRGINVKRWLAGGVASGIVLWLLESAASHLYLGEMQSALAGHNLEIEVTAVTWIESALLSLLIGLTMLFSYAAARPRFGPGPRTALVVAFMLWLGGYVPSLLGFDMMTLFSRRMLVQWGLVGLLEMMIASIVGAWIYREA